MDRTTAVREIKRGLGFRQTQDSSIVLALQSAQRILETGRTLPNWLLEYDAAITVTADVATFDLPEGFLRVHEDYELYYTNSDSARVFIPRRGYTEAYTAYVASGFDSEVSPTPTSEYPQVWVKRSDSVGLFVPTPTTSFTAYLTYYKAAEVLTTDVENAWLANAPDLIIGLAGIKIAGPLRDKGAMELFSMQYKMGQGSFMGQVVEDELQGRGLVMGRNN
jgi:hypothetical protein